VPLFPTQCMSLKFPTPGLVPVPFERYFFNSPHPLGLPGSFTFLPPTPGGFCFLCTPLCFPFHWSRTRSNWDPPWLPSPELPSFPSIHSPAFCNQFFFFSPPEGDWFFSRLHPLRSKLFREWGEVRKVFDSKLFAPMTNSNSSIWTFAIFVEQPGSVPPIFFPTSPRFWSVVPL